MASHHISQDLDITITLFNFSLQKEYDDGGVKSERIKLLRFIYEKKILKNMLRIEAKQICTLEKQCLQDDKSLSYAIIDRQKNKSIIDTGVASIHKIVTNQFNFLDLYFLINEDNKNSLKCEFSCQIHKMCRQIFLENQTLYFYRAKYIFRYVGKISNDNSEEFSCFTWDNKIESAGLVVVSRIDKHYKNEKFYHLSQDKNVSFFRINSKKGPFKLQLFFKWPTFFIENQINWNLELFYIVKKRK